MNKDSKEFRDYAKKHLGISSSALAAYELQSKAVVPHAMTPNIIEERQMNVISMDVFSRLMADRIIFLGLPIDDIVANVVNAQLLFLDSVDKKDIQIYFNTPGGGVHAGLGIYDVMQYIKADVCTINTGMAASMGAVLLAGGAKGKRTALKHSRVMIHQPMGGMYGQASDLQITVNEINKLKGELYDILAHHTGQKYKKIEKDSDRDYWMTAQEAVDYGLIDSVIENRVHAKK